MVFHFQSQVCRLSHSPTCTSHLPNSDELGEVIIKKESNSSINHLDFFCCFTKTNKQMTIRTSAVQKESLNTMEIRINSKSK